VAPPITVPLGSLEARAAPAELAALGLGSCVAITLWDPVARVGGLAHVLLPSPPPGRAARDETRYASTGIPVLIERGTALGADRSRLQATLSGGGAMFVGLNPPGSVQTGERNVVAAREALRVAGVPIRGEWCGGEHGRSVRFDVATGAVTVSSVRHGTRQL
jgi:chemotaxis protein CheD